MAAPLVRPARSGLLFRTDTAPGRVRFGARLSRLFDENWCLETLGSKGRSEANPMRTRSRGLGPGSRQALERWNLFARLEMHGAARHVLQNGPFLAFGKSPGRSQSRLLQRPPGPRGRVLPWRAHVQQILPDAAPWLIAVERRELARQPPLRQGPAESNHVSTHHAALTYPWCSAGKASIQDRRPRSAGGNHRPGPRPIRHIGSEGAVDLHPSCTPRCAPGQGMNLVKVAVSQEIPSTLPLVQGRAKHVRKAMAHRTGMHAHRPLGVFR
jgi:hypothetical protein